MGSSISVVNELEFPIHVALAHLGPVHRVKYLKRGEKSTLKTGKVWFTVRVYAGTRENERYVNEAAQAKAILSAVFGAATFTPIAPVALAAGVASTATNLGIVIDNAKHGDKPDAWEIISLIGSTAAMVPVPVKGFGKQILDASVKFDAKSVVVGGHLTVGDVICACKNSTGCLSEVGGVYADGRTLYIRWNSDHTAIDIIGS